MNKITKPLITALLWAVITSPAFALDPGDILNLTNWKLTLPTGSSGSPTEIKQPQLDSYSDSNFYLPTTPNRVSFKCKMNGVTTSGSSYPRCELREMKNNGSSNASWSTTSGTHTMYIDQKIQNIPKVKKHLVAGQIHDSGDDLIVCRLETKKLFIDHNGDDGPTLTTNYNTGTRFNIKMVASGGKVKFYYNGSLKDTYSASKSGCYFKAGCYPQSNTSKGESSSTFGKVDIYTVTVTHS